MDPITLSLIASAGMKVWDSIQQNEQQKNQMRIEGAKALANARGAGIGQSAVAPTNQLPSTLANIGAGAAGTLQSFNQAKQNQELLELQKKLYEKQLMQDTFNPYTAMQNGRMNLGVNTQF